MARIYEQAYFGDSLVQFADAKLSVASSAVLYGMSVYTVFPIHIDDQGRRVAFRLFDHYKRLLTSSRIMGITSFEGRWTEERFFVAVQDLIIANRIKDDAFVRVTVHLDELVPGVRSRDISSTLSMFAYQAVPILPQGGARLKTTHWRRVPDVAIPPRAKVNGAYVNSVLGKQDALDSGYDDCVFLDTAGHVSELSAANIFLVRNNVLITPAVPGDLLEGISRTTILELAKDLGIQTIERTVDLTELYVADEVFASGTSAYLAPVVEIDSRKIANGAMGSVTRRLY